MKPVYQTKYLKEDGNCLPACIASILEIDLDLIPNPKNDNWRDELNDWLIKNHHIFILSVSFNKESVYPDAFNNNYIIGVGKSCNDLFHAVVCKNGVIIHDPFRNSGLTFDEITEYDLLLKYFG
jgi:hypothetical protein